MKSRTTGAASTIALFALVFGGCENDTNPYGPAYRVVHHTIVGVYRAPTVSEVSRSRVPPQVVPVPNEYTLALVLGSGFDVTGRLIIPGDGVRPDVSAKIYGTWEYHRGLRSVTIHRDPSTPGPQFDLAIEIHPDWVQLSGSVEVGGALIPLDLWKRRGAEEGGGGGGFSPS